jgi:signal transduction histidine kinase
MQPDTDLYRSIFEGFPGALAVLGNDGRLRLANRAARLLGVDLETLPRAAGETPEHTTVSLVDRAGAARVLVLEERRLDGDRLLAIDDITAEGDAEALPVHSRPVESLGYLTASVVHDFNNLLVPLLCTSSLLEDDLRGDTEAGSMAADVRAAAERAAELVRGLMKLIHRQPPAVELVCVDAVLAEMEPLLARGLPEDVELALSLDSGSRYIRADRHGLEVSLLNLVANARDAMPNGGKILVTTGLTARGDRGSAARTDVVIAVKDEGEGMTAEVRARAFERFFTTKGPERGTGLGLPAVQAFVATHGGRVSLTSRAAAGTTVALHLPLDAHIDAPTEAPPPALELPAGTETILVVDDDAAVRYAVRAVLERYGYFVVDALSGDDALQKLGGGIRVDLAIVDIVMPKMNGGDFVKRLRESGQDPKILYVSGHLDATLEVRHAPDRENPVLRKAFSPSELLRSVRRALDS